MAKTLDLMLRRFGSARPGLQLIAVENAAVPVTVVRADVLAQERKELPVTEEFVLRYVALGVDATEEIASFLGLEVGHIIDAAAAQLSFNNLRRRADGRLALTAQGGEVVRTLAATQPVLRQLPVVFDRLTWSLADYKERHLLEKREAQDRGMIILPAARNARIGLEDVTPAGFNALIDANKLQVLRIHKVAVKAHRYLPVQMLVYGDMSRHELQLAVCIDDELAAQHGLALDQIEAVQRLGLSLGDAGPRPLLDPDLEEARTLSELVTAEAQSETKVPMATAVGANVRPVSVFEHPDLLAEAMNSAQQRVLIISPWVRRAVVDASFLSALEQLLRRSVSVTIAHGYGVDDRGSDPDALKRLGDLSARYSNFAFVRLRNTHAKVLIFDGNWVSTSFNWLSFKGDPDRTYRMEEGTLVSIPERVEEAYARYLGMIGEQVQILPGGSGSAS
jgi:hypothetical protein